MYWRCGSRGRMAALQVQSHEFKPQFHQKKKKKKKKKKKDKRGMSFRAIGNRGRDKIQGFRC
jgi:hypothetical protein